MFLVIVAAWVCPASAEDGWSISKLNPFRKKSTADSRARGSVSDEAVAKSRFPHVSMPTWGSRTQTPEPPRKEPSTLAKLNQSTKDFYGKTKSVLMPWSSSSKKSSSKSKKSSSFLTSWLPKKEEKKPKTLNDFLAQPRPY